MRLPERLINAGMSVSGCGIGYVLCMIDAFADGGVKMGLPRQIALKLAASMIVVGLKVDFYYDKCFVE